MDSLAQIVYLSSATSLLNDAELQDLLAQARKRNQELGITGLLLYADGNVMQVLEGPRQRIESVMRDIENDHRHHGILELINESIEERQFPDWSMAYYDMAATPSSGFSDFFHNDNSVHQQYIVSGKAKKLLMSFRDHLKSSKT